CTTTTSTNDDKRTACHVLPGCHVRLLTGLLSSSRAARFVAAASRKVWETSSRTSGARLCRQYCYEWCKLHRYGHSLMLIGNINCFVGRVHTVLDGRTVSPCSWNFS